MYMWVLRPGEVLQPGARGVAAWVLRPGEVLQPGSSLASGLGLYVGAAAACARTTCAGARRGATVRSQSHASTERKAVKKLHGGTDKQTKKKTAEKH